MAPSSVLVKPSTRFFNIIKSLEEEKSVPVSLKEVVKYSRDDARLSCNDIRWIRAKIDCNPEATVPIHKLLMESEIVLPKYEPPPRSPQLEARCQQLRRDQELREYQSMTKNVDFVRIKQGVGIQDMRAEMRSMNKQLVTGLQYLLSIVGTFFAVFMALGFAGFEYGTRALAGIISGVIVAFAEVYFIIRDDMREEERLRKLQKDK